MPKCLELPLGPVQGSGKLLTKWLSTMTDGNLGPRGKGSEFLQRIIIITWLLIMLIELEHIRTYSYRERERESHHQTARPQNACNIFKIPIWLMFVWYFNRIYTEDLNESCLMLQYCFPYTGLKAVRCSQASYKFALSQKFLVAKEIAVWQWHTGPVDVLESLFLE